MKFEDLITAAASNDTANQVKITSHIERWPICAIFIGRDLVKQLKWENVERVNLFVNFDERATILVKKSSNNTGYKLYDLNCGRKRVQFRKKADLLKLHKYSPIKAVEYFIKDRNQLLLILK